MKIRVLGCSGGIGAGLHSTSLLIDDDILIDAGTGVNELSLDEMVRIRHIFLSHTHLDHIACLPLMVDSIFAHIKQPVVIHAQQHTIDVLQQHIFNWAIWPDFASLPSGNSPVMCYAPLEGGESVALEGRVFEAVAVNHIVPTIAFRIASGERSFAFSGDTTTNQAFWRALNAHDALDLLFVEVAFSNEQLALSEMARHYCPLKLAEDISQLKHRPEIFLTHNKPGLEEKILAESLAAMPDRQLSLLEGGMVFTL